MDEGLTFCSFFLLSKDIVLPIPRPRGSSYLLKEEKNKKGNGTCMQGTVILQGLGQSTVSGWQNNVMSRAWFCLGGGPNHSQSVPLGLAAPIAQAGSWEIPACPAITELLLCACRAPGSLLSRMLLQVYHNWKAPEVSAYSSWRLNVY